MSDETLEELARALRGGGASIGATLAALRAAGASMAECVRVVRNVEGVRLGVAKEIVDGSDVWSDRSAANRVVRIEAAEQLGIVDCEEHGDE